MTKEPKQSIIRKTFDETLNSKEILVSEPILRELFSGFGDGIEKDDIRYESIEGIYGYTNTVYITFNDHAHGWIEVSEWKEIEQIAFNLQEKGEIESYLVNTTKNLLELEFDADYSMDLVDTDFAESSIDIDQIKEQQGDILSIKLISAFKISYGDLRLPAKENLYAIDKKLEGNFCDLTLLNKEEIKVNKGHIVSISPCELILVVKKENQFLDIHEYFEFLNSKNENLAVTKVETIYHYASKQANVQFFKIALQPDFNDAIKLAQSYIYQEDGDNAGLFFAEYDDLDELWESLDTTGRVKLMRDYLSFETVSNN